MPVARTGTDAGTPLPPTINPVQRPIYPVGEYKASALAPCDEGFASFLRRIDLMRSPI